MKAKILTVAAAVLSAVTLCAQANPPLKNVVLYSSGVGMFVHNTTVENEKTVTLSLSEAQLNDALKSLLILGDSGLLVKSVKYDGKDTLEQQFQDTQIKLSGQTSLISLLESLKGCAFDLEVFGNGAKFTNWRYIGHTNVATAPELNECMLNFLVDDQIRSVKLLQIKNITPSDPALRANLKRAMEIMAQKKDISSKQLRVQVESAGKKQEMNLAYIIAAPVWKASYRLILPEQGAKAALQMWAIVENPTSEPWENINLSLVSGKPTSFVQDLYSTLYRNRPVIASAGTSQPQALPTPEAKAKGVVRYYRNAVAEDAAVMAEIESGAKKAEKIGSYCRYELNKPVSLQGREAAMLPMDTLKLDAEVVSIYRKYDNTVNPRHAILLKNKTDLLLPAGPVTVYSNANTYAGDASMPEVVPGQDLTLMYGVDLEMEVTFNAADRKYEEKYTDLRKVKNSKLLYMNKKKHQQYKVSVANKSTEKKTVLLDLPKWTSHAQLTQETIKPLEEKNGLYRLKVEVEPGAVRTEKVTESYTETTQNELAQNMIESFDIGDAKLDKISPAARDFFTKGKEIVAKIRKLEKANSDLIRQENTLRDTHTRTRETYVSLKDNAEYSATLAQRIAKLDQDLFKIYDTKEKNLAEIKKLEADLKKLINDSEF